MKYSTIFIKKMRETLENNLSKSLATMEQELQKCIFDERGNGLVYLQKIQEEQVWCIFYITKIVNCRASKYK